MPLFVANKLEGKLLGEHLHLGDQHGLGTGATQPGQVGVVDDALPGGIPPAGQSLVKGLFRDLLVVIDWLETHIVLAESPGRLWPKAIRTSWARLFAWAGRVRYAWRPAATRTMVRETVAAARQPTRIDGAIPSFC